MGIQGRFTSFAAGLLISTASGALAQETTWTLYGTPGLIEMPSARSAPDAEIAATISYWDQQQRNNFSFQITPRLSGTFRYTGIANKDGPGTDTLFDRSFDLRYRILDETDRRPAVAIGLQDFLGTGRLSGEYIVATKAITPSIDVTAGIGWGRFGSNGGFINPFRLGDRPGFVDGDTGGEVSFNQFFRGDAALFGGIDYRLNDKISLQAEYSSDGYTRETANGAFDPASPYNFGINYRLRPDVTLTASYLYGTDLAAGVTLMLNPTRRIPVSGLETAPTPVAPRNALAAISWGVPAVQDALDDTGITLNAVSITGTTARIRYTNTTYRSEAQGLGRVARVLTATLPPQIETFVLEPMQNGIPLSATTLQRRDLEALADTADAAAAIQSRSVTTDAGRSAGLTRVPSTDPAFAWGIAPYAQLIVFNGDAPVQADVGLDFSARYTIRPNLVFAGNIRQSALGEREIADIFDPVDDIPNVRTDARFFGVDGTPVLTDLTLAHYSRPAPNLYGRLTLGYLEQMYGGLSSEMLWKPVDSPLAFGAEVNYVQQRDFDGGFGFQDYDTVTGHLSAYYSFDNGFHTQLDVGRYLAGDWGATFALDREFENGWKIGAYATLTDLPFEDFGEGSFDKGIRITVPHDFFIGTASRREVNTRLNSLTRDGGARVNVDGRLYDIVRDGHTEGPLGDTWGRFWR